MSVASSTKFATDYAPLNWAAQKDMFGQTVYYTPRATGETVELDVVWKEGAEDEAQSPGIYSNITLCDAELGETPSNGDVVEDEDGTRFKVQQVDAYATGYSRCVLKEIV